jgi:hypothetical protein
LLSELTPLDVRQLFITHKPAFYAEYRKWPDAKKEYVAEFLHRDYAANKAGARDALFGGAEPEANPPAPTGKAPRERDIIELVGPWGSVLRR